MPKASACTFHSCAKGYLQEGKQLNKSQKQHVEQYHLNKPPTLNSEVAGSKISLTRQPGHGMNFTCVCTKQFLLASSTQRHYRDCPVARAAILEAIASWILPSSPPTASELDDALETVNASLDPTSLATSASQPQQELQQHDGQSHNEQVLPFMAEMAEQRRLLQALEQTFIRSAEEHHWLLERLSAQQRNFT